VAASESERLPENELIGQMSTMTFGAMDTTSGALSRILHLLAKNPNTQAELRNEISEARAKSGDLDYNSLDDLPLLDAVIRETLRLYTPVPLVHKIARKDAILPLYKPIMGTDGRILTEIHVPKGTTIEIAIMKANRDPSVWGSDALEWKPQRWLKPLPTSVIDAHYPAVYSNLMTFVGGRKACIGFKFSELEMKVVLSILIESFIFSETKQDIQWNLGGIAHPVVPKSATPAKPQMPLIVTAVTTNDNA